MDEVPAIHPLRHAWEASQRGDLNAAWPHYLRAIAEPPDDADGLQRLGYLALELEDDDTAVLALGKASLRAPASPETAMLLGVGLRRKAALARAAESFERALRFRPEWPDCINNLAVTLEELGRLDEAHDWVQRGIAITEYERALELDPDFEPARLNLADAQRAARAA